MILYMYFRDTSSLVLWKNLETYETIGLKTLDFFSKLKIFHNVSQTLDSVFKVNNF